MNKSDLFNKAEKTNHSADFIYFQSVRVPQTQRFIQQSHFANQLVTLLSHDKDLFTRHIEPEHHFPGKRNMQKIERKRLNLRTRLKRLMRKTICFSKSEAMHDIVIGLFTNRYEFGAQV